MGISTIDQRFDIHSDDCRLSADLIHSLVLGVIRDSNPIGGKLEEERDEQREQRYVSVVGPQEHQAYRAKVLQEIEWTYTDGSMFSRGRNLYSPCGTIYVTSAGIFLVFVAYQHPFQLRGDEGRVDEVYHFGF